MVPIRWMRGIVIAAAAWSVAPALLAQIRIGLTAGYSGGAAAAMKETTEGAKLYINAVNAKGGIGGRVIELKVLDDNFDPKRSVENAKQLINEGVLGLFLTRGAPSTEAIIPLLNQYKVPLIAPSAGAMVLHEPVNPWIFNVRASHQREAERAVQHLNGIGMARIALLQADDEFGKDAAAGALKGFTAIGKQPVLQEKFDAERPDY